MATAQSSWHQRLGLVAYYGKGEELLAPLLSEFFDTVPIMGPRSPLCELMTAQNSDKGNWWHNYTLLYDFIFRRQRYEIKHLFEVGIGSNFPDTPSNMGARGSPGASLRAWRDYFPNAQIVGADIDSRVLFSEDRIRTFHVDQLDEASIDALWNRIDEISFDIIIDDGLHRLDANATFLKKSFRKLRPYGYYFIEDIVTSRENLQKFSEFFRSCNLSSAIVRLPIPTNNGDNCLAVLRSNTASTTA
jgi:hypothetical protein